MNIWLNPPSNYVNGNKLTTNGLTALAREMRLLHTYITTDGASGSAGLCDLVNPIMLECLDIARVSVDANGENTLILGPDNSFDTLDVELIEFYALIGATDTIASYPNEELRVQILFRQIDMKNPCENI